MSEAPFRSDGQVGEVAEAYALDTVDLAARNFRVTLDWSEATVRHVEQMPGQRHDEMASAQPSEDAVWTFAKAFGSYVGEVLRWHRGGEWSIVTMGGRSLPGLQQSAGSLC
jgi:hypothetical protein